MYYLIATAMELAETARRPIPESRRLLAPQMRQKGEIDPTRVTVHDHFKFLVVTSGRPPPLRMIRETARIARRVDAELLILNVQPDPEQLVDGNIAETVVDVAREHRVDYIYLSSQANTSGGHDITTAILENSAIPVVVIDEDRE